MLRGSERKTVSERFADQLRAAELTDAYQIDRLKVEISERIYHAMNQQDVTNAELARRLGKSRAYVTKLLRGTTNFTLESLVRIGRALACEVELELVPKISQTKPLAVSKAVKKTSSKAPAKGTRKRSKKHSPKPTLFG
jgi:transcriptional regulator with XRE-family HTH domain